MKRIVGGIILILLAGGVINNISHQQPPIQKQSTPTTQNGLPEKTLHATYGDDVRNTITVVLPKNRNEQTPFILFLHGGAWTSGDKKDIAIIQTILSQQGIASAAMNYRYASKNVHYKELMEDVDNAVSYIENTMTDWNIGKKKITIGGISAGGHMALLYGYAYDTRDNIGSIISMAGPTDLAAIDMLDTAAKNNMLGFVNSLVGANYTKGVVVSDAFNDASPISHIKNIPTLLIHGNKDTIVLYNQSAKLNDLLEKKNIPHKLLTIEGANHDLGLANPRNATRIAQELTAWIQQYK